ncbi:E3 ubiquitin-protein ligase MIB1-like [Pomacea canaliculata]|uniref:E3 ubiquitin-protein ligase MIB1-like n=1 Tax=Pomacea canaliculata TaxID=400727 RepID=UPI000D73BD03|nr:E3 ubiquitin-protein ligase MIB1-like [Pomacea canaliculata]
MADGVPRVRCMAFENVAPSSTRNLVRVAWPNGVVNSYRLGLQGQVDLTCVEEEVGPFYYRDHLQLVDSSGLPLPLAQVESSASSLPTTIVSPTPTASEAVVTTSISTTTTTTTTTASLSQTSSSSGASCGSVSSKGSCDEAKVFAGNEFSGGENCRKAAIESVIEEDELLMVGDKVIIGVNEERLAKLQQTFGGCTKGMISRIGIEGVVTAVPSPQTPAVSVKYTEKQSYRLNPAVLVKITSFTQGDVVRVRSDAQQVRFLNKSLGWSETMEKVCGKVGRVRAVDSSCHVTVRLGSQELKFHARLLDAGTRRTTG